MKYKIKDGSEVEIAKATLSDIDDIIEIWKDIINWHSSFDKDFALDMEGTQNYKMMLNTALVDLSQIVLVAKLDHKVVGFLYGYLKKYSGFFKKRNVAHISDIAVIEQHRNKGIGSLLVNYFKDHFAEQNNADEITLYVHIQNENAIKFYKRHKFETKLLIMRKKLKH
ncbi:MAG: GNAT family N-acetyltransferase [Candidatus Heimdallarchaeaceae archaeon]